MTPETLLTLVHVQITDVSVLPRKFDSFLPQVNVRNPLDPVFSNLSEPNQPLGDGNEQSECFEI